LFLKDGYRVNALLYAILSFDLTLGSVTVNGPPVA
jgi:hypothetical protein